MAALWTEGDGEPTALTVTWTPDGKTERPVKLYRNKSGKEVKMQNPQGIAVDGSGLRQYLVDDNGVYMTNAFTGVVAPSSILEIQLTMHPWLYGMPLTRVDYPGNFRLQNENVQRLDQVPYGKASQDGRVILIPSHTSKGLLVSEDYGHTFRFDPVGDFGSITAVALSPDGSVRLAASGLKVRRWTTFGQQGKGKWSETMTLVVPSGDSCVAVQAGMSWPENRVDVLEVFAVNCRGPGDGKYYVLKLGLDGASSPLIPADAIRGPIKLLGVNDLGSLVSVSALRSVKTWDDNDQVVYKDGVNVFFQFDNFSQTHIAITYPGSNSEYTAMSYTHTQLDDTLFGNYLMCGPVYVAVGASQDGGIIGMAVTYLKNPFVQDMGADGIPVYITMDDSGSHVQWSGLNPSVFPAVMRNAVYYFNRNSDGIYAIYNMTDAIEVDWRLTYGYPQALPHSMYPPIQSGDGKLQVVLDSDHMWIGRMESA
eukprot:GDKI01036078.1.p1 GENE.GDKI01036078.1~~GDKI01036078.1.p1  ORF type:complete len:480 (-),score=90.09 GDKI01036078.1:190-1629(-)